MPVDESAGRVESEPVRARRRSAPVSVSIITSSEGVSRSSLRAITRPSSHICGHEYTVWLRGSATGSGTVVCSTSAHACQWGTSSSNVSCNRPKLVRPKSFFNTQSDEIIIYGRREVSHATRSPMTSP